MSLSKSCLRCASFLMCSDRRKSATFRCERFIQLKNVDSLADLFDVPLEPTQPKHQQRAIPIVTNTDVPEGLSAEEDAEDENGDKVLFVLEAMRKSYDPLTNTAVDVTLDTSDLPLAPNFYHFCKYTVGEKIKMPFARQLWIGYRFFSEWCPRCSDPAYNEITRIEVDADPEEVLDHVTLLENGRCPKCNASKSQMVLSNELNDYNELDLVLGQRCLVGSTNVFTQDGLMKISEYAEGRPLGFSSFALPVFNGSVLEQSSDFFKSKPELVTKIRLRNGFEVTGTKDHPVYTLEGFKPLSDVTIDDYVKISWNQNVYGNKTVALNSIYKNAVKTFDALAGTTRNLIQTSFKADLPVLDADLASLLGLWVAEGRGCVISNQCPEVLTFLNTQLLRLVNARYIKSVTETNDGSKGVRVRGRLFAEFWKGLLGVEDLLSGSAKKEIPLAVRQGPKEYLTGFLRGLYEGDGGVEGVGISYNTISKELAQQVSSCLSNLGIRNRKGYYSTWASNGSENQISKPGFSVWIQGPDVERFQKEIGFISSRKKKSLERVVARHNERVSLQPFYEDTLPDPVKQALLHFIKLVVDSLRGIPLPKELMTTKTLVGVRSTKSIGFATVFGLTNSEAKVRADGSVCLALCDGIKRLRDDNVSLNKKKLKRILGAIEQFRHFLPIALTSRLSYFESFLDDSAFIKVKSITHSTREMTTYDFTLPRTHTFWANGIINHNSGKSTLLSLMGAYHVHRLLKVPRLSSICNGIQDFTPIQGTFVGLSFARAKKLLWSPFTSIIERSDWFQQYHKVLDNYKNRYGKELYRQSSEFLRYNHQNIEFYPSGPMKRTLRGDTRCMAGNTLVYTTEGLIPISNKDLVGKRVSIGGREFPITHHFNNGYRSVVKVKLATGAYFETTPDHLFKALNADYTFKNVPAEDLLGMYLPVELGGTFGTGDLTDFVIPEMRSDRRISMFEYMYKVKTFTTKELKQYGWRLSNSITTPMQQNNHLKKGHRDSEGYQPFTLVDGVPLAELLSTYCSGLIRDKSNITFPKQDNFELGYVLGSMVADGSYRNDSEFSYSTKDLERAQVFHKYVCDLFGFRFKLHTFENDDYSTYNVRFSTENVKSFFRWLGLLSATSRVKEVPSRVLTGSKEMVIGYLAGHLVSDGCMRSGNPCYTTTSKEVSNQLTALLSSVGVLAQVKSSPYDSIRSVAVYAPFNKRFRKLVVDRLPTNKSKYEKVTDFVFEERGEHGFSFLLAPYSLSTGGKRRLRVKGSDALLQDGLSPKLAQLIKETATNVFYVPVSEVVALEGKKEVFDITIKSKQHLFRAGVGASLHNCMAMIDELGWFPFDLNKDSEQMGDEEDERERANADEVHQSLSNSLATIRTEMWNLYSRDINHIPGGIMLNASSPASWKDKICRLLKDAEGSKFMLGLRMPTWEINPIFTRDHPVITEAYRKNPIKADRDFGANPPSLSSSVYSKNAIQRLFTGYQHHALAIEVSDPIIPGEDKKVFGRAVIKQHKNIWPASILALDAGLSNNAFSGVLAFMQDQVMIVATLFEVVPTGGRKIHFPSMMKFIINPIIEQCNVHYVFADRWNSVLLLQQVPMDYPKVLAAQYTLKGRDFDTFNSDFIETGNLVLPKLELPTEQIETVTNYKQELNGYPASHLYLQFLTVRELQGVITKGDGYTDDIYRALVLAAARIRDPKVTEHLRKFAPVERVMGDFSNRLLITGRSGLDFSRVNDMLK